MQVHDGDRAFVIYDLAASERFPAEVVGFDRDVPPVGKGPGECAAASSEPRAGGGKQCRDKQQQSAAETAAVDGAVC